MDIDLGELRPKANVKLGSETYKVSLPTIADSERLDSARKAKGDNDMDIYYDFFDTLGMPKDVCKSLTADQLTKLSEGLIGASKKK